MTKPAPKLPIPQSAAACTAFAAFSVSIFVGIASNNPFDVILTRALVAMLGGFVGGFLVGLVCDWIVNQEVTRVESAMEADLAAADAEEVDLDGLTGVDVLEDEPGSVASRAVQTENREAVGRRREKNAA